jgi:NADPH:quinone reductase-like Zn-dependent oxidoreductase
LKAVVHERYGPPEGLELREVEKPTPKDDEALVRIRAVSVNGSDRENLVGRPLYVRIAGLLRPAPGTILGSDIAGVVEAVGTNVTEFRPGDEVFGEIPGYHGGFAEYASLPEKNLLPRPASLSFEQASCIPQAGVIALQGIRDKGKVQPGMRVLINGAGGSAGTFAVQLAKMYGAEVTAVDNAGKLEFLGSLGADYVIDYAREDFTKNGKQYDFILDVTAQRSVFDYARALAPGGRYYFVGGSVGVLFSSLILGSWVGGKGKKVQLLMVMPNRESLKEITELCATGKIVPVIDKVYPLERVREAMRYVVEGRAKGKVVITVGEQ